MAEKNAEKTAAKTDETAKVEVPKVEIIRGRMPLPIVFQVKFDTGTDAELAAKYRTTNGKVSDIKKDRNFGYITKGFKPTQEMVDAAVVYAAQLKDASVVKSLKAMPIASEKEAAAFIESRKATRKTVAPAEATSAVDEATK